ncbi:hypothetical protein [Helicobacter sp. T3_23-1059]
MAQAHNYKVAILAHKRKWVQLLKQNLYLQGDNRAFNKPNKIDCQDFATQNLAMKK